MEHLTMKPVSPKPESFANEAERYCWQVAQDIAFRAGFALVQRDSATWLVSETEQRLICELSRADKIWRETLRLLEQEFPLLERIWVGGRAITKPGELR